MLLVAGGGTNTASTATTLLVPFLSIPIKLASNTRAYLTGFRIFLAPTPTGSLLTGGIAPVLKSKSFLPTGGLVYAGTGPRLKSKSFLPTGGLVYAGTSTNVKIKVPVASGGLVVAQAVSKRAVLAPSAAS